ncbi:MAG TPA: phosphate ABC transporter substrate-binding protein [Acidimicrobiales bacterium]|nr:phosphate ABC transporter substrate-binding protein [Acidimicrobiales bacterium]
MRRRPAALVATAATAVLALASTACGGSSNAATGAAGSSTLRVSGSTTVGPVVADAAEALRKQGLEVTVDTQGGSGGGIAQLGAGEIDVAMSSKPITEEEAARHPGVDFTATVIGADALAVVVRREVVDGGLTSLTRAQLRDLFEGRIRNWSELGGPDLETFVYDKEPGRGTREVLDRYLYGPDGKAPPPPTEGNYAVVGGNEETRTKLASTPGSVAPLSAAFVEGRRELAVLAVDGVAPSAATVGDGTYPLARQLFLLTDGPPAGAARTLVDYVLSEAGQALVTGHGFLTVAESGS